MPPLPVVPNVVRAQLIWSTTGDSDVQCHFYFKYTGGPPNATDCTNFASDIFTAMAAEFAEWSNAITLRECIVTDLSSNTGGQGSDTGSAPGGKTEQPLSLATSVVENFHISRRYRGGKPRVYLPWGVSSDLTDRRDWNGAFLTGVDSAITSFVAAVVGLNSGSTTISGQVNISYFDGFTVVTNPTTGRAKNVPKRRTTPLVDDILSHTASSRPGSQRRRN
jgi:hypothetical protein